MYGITSLSCRRHILRKFPDNFNPFVPPFEIRCIKPNREQLPNQFDPDLVLSQVRSLAVVRTAHIRNLGYPVWLSFDAFIERFGPLEVLPIRKQKCFTLKLDFYNLGLVHTEVFQGLSLSLAP